jgi:hypothetical protein
MVKMDVEADLKEIRKPLPPSPIKVAEIQELFTRSHLLKARGTEFSEVEAGIWALKRKGLDDRVTFDSTLFEEKPSLRLMTLGRSLIREAIGGYLRSINRNPTEAVLRQAEMMSSKLSSNPAYITTNGQWSNFSLACCSQL